MFRRLFRWFLGTRKRSTITNAQGVPYMHRYYLLEWPWRIRIHEILRSDEDRDMHDHPYDFVSIMLKGGYIETAHMSHDELERLFLDTADHEEPCHCSKCAIIDSGPPFESKRAYRPGAIRRLKAEDAHRIQLNTKWLDSGTLLTVVPAWTLIFAGPIRREWGFHTQDGWMHWKAYLDKKFGPGKWQAADLELRKEMD